MKILLLTLTLLSGILLNSIAGQQPDGKIHLKNPSFEDFPRASACPEGWSSHTPGSTPDIMPGAWDVQAQPFDGGSCVALVTREDGTLEDIAQKLSEPLKPGTCYTFSIYLAHAPDYVGYNHPARLRIWGGTGPDKKQLLASSALVDHEDWKAYKFQFVPNHTMQYITLEVYFAPGALFKYRGNILLDLCSPIERCDRA
ncbi:MAG: hypothetical protein EP344_16990 [Bacteroidetes bacterium]|nr:MAG: hypothetical protein EP344_16990 [Bacteroidota bacterium]